MSINVTAYAINFPNDNAETEPNWRYWFFAGNWVAWSRYTVHHLSINNIRINRWPFSESIPFSPHKKKILRTSPIHAHCFGMQMVYTWYISFERVRATDFDYCCSLRFRPIVIRANQRNVETNVWYNIIGRLPESTFNKQNVRH